MKRKAAVITLGAALFVSVSASAQALARNGVLVAGDGMTLYTFDKDSRDRSACTGLCAGNWPPLMAGINAKAEGDYSIVARDDGGRQWAYKGKPLYYWKDDKKVGDLEGDNRNNVWHVVAP